MKLAGKVAVVTGGGGGLGEGEVEALARAGADVAVVDSNADRATGAAERLAARTGRRVIGLTADIADRASVEAMTAEVVRRLGGLHILVNNAGIFPKRPWDEVPEAEWDRVLDVNLKGAFLCARAAVPHMAAAGWGKVVNIASITLFGMLPELLPYVCSKAGLVGFTRALAREVGAQGITVNAIAPGAFPTDGEKIHPDPEGYNRFVLGQQSVKRRGTPADLGAAVLFFSSPDSDFITGQTLVVDGGWVMY